MKRVSSFLFAAGLGIAVVASAASRTPEIAASGQTTTVDAPIKQATASPKVAKIVFVGKKNACDCTRKRVDDSFAAMQKALQGRSDIAVERIQVDVDEEAAAQYQKLRPIMVLPAIYLLENTLALGDLLQGEVAPEQLRKAIGD